MITNPAPAQIESASWSVEAGINKFTVSIPIRPADNDLAGIIVLAKEGTGQTLTFPDDVFYRGPWSDLIVVDTDDDNQALLPNQAYTVAVAAFDEFGTDSLTFSATKNVTTAQVETNDIKDSAVTNSKIYSIIADKITAGTITGSTLQTASSGKRFEVTTTTNEARFYGVNDTTTNDITQLVSIGAYNSATVYSWPNAGDSNATYTGGASAKIDSPYGVKFTSTGTVTFYSDDFIPGVVYTFECINSAGSNITIDMGGTAVTIPSGSVSSNVTCTRPYLKITNSGTIGGTEYLTVISVSRSQSDYLVYAGSQTTTKNGAYFVSKNRALTAYSYSTDFTSYIRNSNTGSGIAIIGVATRASQDDSITTRAGYFTAGAGAFGYSGTDPTSHVLCVEGATSGPGTAIYGNTNGNPLGDGYAAFKSNGDSDFRGGVVYFKSYTVTTLPSAAIAGGMIYVSNESGGAVMAFSDGTNWRRVTDRAIVS